MDSGSSSNTGLLQEFWHMIKKHHGIALKSQDDDLKSIRESNNNVIIVGRHVKQPNDRAQKEARLEMARNLQIAAIDKFLFGDAPRKDKEGNELPDKCKDNLKILNDAEAEAMAVVWGIRSPSQMDSGDEESHNIE